MSNLAQPSGATIILRPYSVPRFALKIRLTTKASGVVVSKGCNNGIEGWGCLIT